MEEIKRNETRKCYALIGVLGITLLAFLMLVSVAGADTTYRLDNSVEDGATQDETVTATVSGNSIIFQLTPTQASDGWFDQVGFPTDVNFAGLVIPNGGYAHNMENLYIDNIGYFDAVTYMVSSRPISKVTVFFNGNLPPSPIFYAKVSWSKAVPGQSFTSSVFTNIPKSKEKVSPTITWDNPADIVYGTQLSSTQLSASASVPGTFVYTLADGTPATGAVISAGTHILNVDFTPDDAENYSNASKDVTINVLKATPTITWSNPADIIQGTSLSSTQLNAVASVPGTFVYTPAEGTVLSTGTQTLHIDFTPTDTVNYNTASKDVTIKVLMPAQKIEQIISTVQNLNLNSGQSNSLIVKLNAAVKSLNLGKTNESINKLNSFNNEVKGYMNSGLLSQAEGQVLIDAANSVINALPSK